MTTVSGRESARVYQFPTKAAAATRRQSQGGQFATDVTAPRMPTVEFGSAWYHEAALQDAERSRKP